MNKVKRKGWTNKKAKRVIIVMSYVWGFILLPYLTGFILKNHIVEYQRDFIIYVWITGFVIDLLLIVAIIPIITMINIVSGWINEK